MCVAKINPLTASKASGCGPLCYGFHGAADAIEPRRSTERATWRAPSRPRPFHLHGAGAPPPLSPRSVAAGNGATWWGEAWRLFAPAIGVWLLIVVILFVLSMVLALVPVVGHLASQVLFPVFMGGLMLGCRAIDRGQPLTVNHLFAGFSERAGPLIVAWLAVHRHSRRHHDHGCRHLARVFRRGGA